MSSGHFWQRVSRAIVKIDKSDEERVWVRGIFDFEGESSSSMFQAVVTFLRTCQTSFETVTVLHSLVFPNVTETRRLIKKKKHSTQTKDRFSVLVEGSFCASTRAGMVHAHVLSLALSTWFNANGERGQHTFHSPALKTPSRAITVLALIKS
jgi:hypothetical protein